MGGGNESPRQKMIGMMYLVLTALLALNVSKSILDAFVAIEENIQVANENEYARGQEKKGQLEEVANDKTVPANAEKAIKYLKDVESIDKLTAEMIVLIDNCKLEIMTACAEAITKDGKNAPGVPEAEGLIHTPYDAKKAPCKPIRMHLAHVQGPDKYDEPMFVMGISDSPVKPIKRGKELWDKYNEYRKKIIELTVKSASKEGKAYSLKVAEINKFKDAIDLNKQVDKMFEKGMVSPDEIDELKKIYKSLSKNKMVEGHDQEVHWIGKTFDHNPQVAGIASLSSVEKEVLTARADAIALIRSRVGGGDYSFNKVQGFAFGPSIANSGAEVEISVMMAAFDSDKQPEVKANGARLKGAPKDGIGVVIANVSGGGEMKLSGQVGIAKKSGEMKYMPWEHTIKIMKPEGSVTLPEMMVMYENYENKVFGVASGYESTSLSGEGCVISGGSNFDGKPCSIARPTVKSPGNCYITVSGKNSINNETKSLGKFAFRIKPLPRADVFIGGLPSGSKISTVPGILSSGFPKDALLQIPSQVISWSLKIKGVPPLKGDGAALSAAAINTLKTLKSGDPVMFDCTVLQKGTTFNKTAAFTIK